MDIWIKVERGIRYREHLTRKHGAQRRPDRYYVIRLSVDGIMRQEALGWELDSCCQSNILYLIQTTTSLLPKVAYPVFPDRTRSVWRVAGQ